jgi:signal transduction histidine kinase
MHGKPLTTSPAEFATREAIHDLRNLFGIVASARHLLDDAPAEEKRHQLLDAISEAAMRGGALTTDLLARHQPDHATRSVDVNREIERLEPLLRASIGAEAVLELDLCARRPRVRVDRDELEAVIIELLINARAACPGAARIRLRTRYRCERLWLTVADNGCGMGHADLERLLTHVAKPGARGTGFGRVRSFVGKAHGRLNVRSRAGRGTVVSLNLPTVLSLAADEPAVLRERRSLLKEYDHEDRQPIAA